MPKLFRIPAELFDRFSIVLFGQSKVTVLRHVEKDDVIIQNAPGEAFAVEVHRLKARIGGLGGKDWPPQPAGGSVVEQTRAVGQLSAAGIDIEADGALGFDRGLAEVDDFIVVLFELFHLSFLLLVSRLNQSQMQEWRGARDTANL